MAATVITGHTKLPGRSTRRMVPSATALVEEEPTYWDYLLDHHNAGLVGMGCCRGENWTAAPVGNMTRAECHRKAYNTTEAVAYEVNGCLKSSCTGTCYLFYNVKRDLVAADCGGVMGDKLCYQKQGPIFIGYGCCRGPSGWTAKFMGVQTYDQCAAIADRNRDVTAFEVNGCRDNSNCGGPCYMYYNLEKGIRAGNCGGDDFDKKCYRKLRSFETPQPTLRPTTPSPTSRPTIQCRQNQFFDNTLALAIVENQFTGSAIRTDYFWERCDPIQFCCVCLDPHTGKRGCCFSDSITTPCCGATPPGGQCDSNRDCCSVPGAICGIGVPNRYCVLDISLKAEIRRIEKSICHMYDLRASHLYL